MSDFKAKKAPNSISAGAPLQTQLGELTALPKPPADPIPALGPPGLETTCLPKYVSLNPPILAVVLSRWQQLCSEANAAGLKAVFTHGVEYTAVQECMPKGVPLSGVCASIITCEYTYQHKDYTALSKLWRFFRWCRSVQAVASLGRERGEEADRPGWHPPGSYTRLKINLLWLDLERTQDKRRGSGEETTAKRGHHFQRRWLTNKKGCQIFQEKNRVTPISCRPVMTQCGPGDTNLIDVTVCSYTFWASMRIAYCLWPIWSLSMLWSFVVGSDVVGDTVFPPPCSVIA